MELEKLSIYEIIHGLFLSLGNAQSLIEDAELLYNNNRIPRAFVISQLANEEIGKALILYNLYMSLKIEGEIIDHKSKTFKATMADFDIAANKKLTEEETEIVVNKIVTEIKKSKNHYNNLKNYGLYVSFIENKFISPVDSITTEDAKSALFKAKDRYKSTFFIAEREVDYDLKYGTHPKFYTDL